MDISEIYISLIVCYLKKEISETEKQKLFEWVYNKPENEKLFFSLKDIWETAYYEKITEKSQTDDEWEKFVLKAIKEQSENYKKRKFSIQQFKKAIQIAALIVITLGIGFLSNHLIPQKQEYATVNVPYGAKSQIELSDGSKVWINSGSKLSYPNNLDQKELNLYLDGEAYFEINKDQDRKLNVNTSTISIQVHGTSFNVKSYDDDDIVETTLVRGSISISGKVGNKSIEHPILLNPNQQATLTKSHRDMTIRKIGDEKETKEEVIVSQKKQEEKKIKQPTLNIAEKVEIEDFTSWRFNKLVFKSERFEDLAVKLERWYNVEIELEDTGLKNSLYTGTFEKENIEQAIQALSLSLPFKYEINKNHIRIIKKIN